MPSETFVRNEHAVLQLFAHLAGQTEEAVGFAYLDPEWRLLGLRYSGSRGRRSVRVPLRTVARDAIRLNASGVVMAHNHPAGDPRPSRADLTATRRLAVALDALGVRLFEHLILVADGRYHSLRGAGLL